MHQLFPKTKQKIIKYKHFNSWRDGIVVRASTSKLVNMVYLPCQVIPKKVKKYHSIHCYSAWWSVQKRWCKEQASKLACFVLAPDT